MLLSPLLQSVATMHPSSVLLCLFKLFLNSGVLSVLQTRIDFSAQPSSLSPLLQQLLTTCLSLFQHKEQVTREQVVSNAVSKALAPPLLASRPAPFLPSSPSSHTLFLSGISKCFLTLSYFCDFAKAGFCAGHSLRAAANSFI